MPRISTIYSNKKHCGIRDYALQLAVNMPEGFSVLFHEKKLRAPRISRFWQYFLHRREAKRLAAAVNVSDLAHVHYDLNHWNSVDPFFNTFSAFVKALRVPLVITIHELGENFGCIGIRQNWHGYKDRVRRVLNRLVRTVSPHSPLFNLPVLMQAQAIIVHHASHKELLQTNGVENVRIHVIEHPVPTLPPPSISKEEMRKRLGLSDQPLLATVGFLNPRKCIERVISALTHMDCSYHLLILGAANSGAERVYQQALEDRMHELGLSERVHFMGYLTDVDLIAWLHAADLSVAPYLFISASGSITYSLACGCPVLASAFPATSLIQEMCGGIRTMPFDEMSPQGIAEACLSIFRDPDTLVSMRHEAVRYAKDHGYSAAAAKLASIYNCILAGTKS